MKSGSLLSTAVLIVVGSREKRPVRGLTFDMNVEGLLWRHRCFFVVLSRVERKRGARGTRLRKRLTMYYTRYLPGSVFPVWGCAVVLAEAWFAGSEY